MKHKLILIAATTIIIAACSTSKKNITSTSSTAATTSTITTSSVVASVPASTTSAASVIFIKPADGVYPPGNEELTAIQAQYKDITLEKLKDGYTIYAQGACIKCHQALNIYYIDPFKWGFILDNMAMRAALSQTQKEAVYQYVLAIKAAKLK